MNRFEKKKQATHNRIIETAQEFIVRNGVRELNMEEICKKADISRATLYNHFSGREELLSTVLSPMYEDSTGEINMLLNSSEEVTIEKIGALCLSLWEGHRELFASIAGEEERLPSTGEVEKGHSALRDSFRELFTRLPAQDRFRVKDPRLEGEFIYRLFTPLLDALEHTGDFRSLFPGILRSLVYESGGINPPRS